MLTGIRILLVEDEALIAMAAEDALKDAGATVSLAMRQSAAMSLARGGQFDLAVLDVNLGSETSFPVAECLETRGIPFLFATGYGVAGLPSRFQGRPVIEKPYAPEDLATAAAELLAS